MSDGGGAPQLGARQWMAIALVAVTTIIGIIVVSRLQTSVPHPPAPTTTAHSTAPTGRAAVGVDVEIPTTPTTTTARSGSSTSSTAAPHSTDVPSALRTDGYDVVGISAETRPPAATTVQYLAGHGAAAQTIAELLGLPATAVGPYRGTRVGLPAGTDVVVQVARA